MGLFDIDVAGNIITIPGLSVREGHSRFRCAILDGEIPITMPVGFELNTPTNMSPIPTIGRNHCCQESMVAIATNVAGIILVGEMADEVDIEEQIGVITTDNATWRSKGKHACRPINPGKRILTATAPMSVRFLVRKAAGYHSMADNASYIGDRAYFPLNTVHTLIDYVRVLPLVGNTIEVRYLNGMTAELFKQIWEEAVQ